MSRLQRWESIVRRLPKKTPLVENRGGALHRVRVINHPAPGSGNVLGGNMVDDFPEETDIVKFTFSNRYYLTGPFRFICGIFMVWWPNNAHYTLTNQRLKIRLGVLSKRTDEIELYRVKDVEYKAGLFERIWGIGTIRVISTQKTDQALIIKGIKNAEQIREDIRKQVQLARRRFRTTELDVSNDAALTRGI